MQDWFITPAAGALDWQGRVEKVLVEQGPPGRREFADSCWAVLDAFKRGDPEGAVEMLFSMCDHSLGSEPILDLLELRAAALLLASEPHPGQKQLEELHSRQPEARWADALLFLGQTKPGLAFYAEQEPDLRSANSLGIISSLLGEQKASAKAFRDALDLPGYTDLEKVPVRYNLGLQLFWTAHHHEALAEFRRCRSYYPHYRRVLQWIAGLKALIGTPSGPGSGAISLPIPGETHLKAIAAEDSA